MQLSLDELEKLITDYKSENDSKKKYVIYLKLVEKSLFLVKKIVSQMYTLADKNLMEDLIQVGALGMLRAIETYEPNRKGSYKTYVRKVIQGKVLHYLRDKVNLIKLPRESAEAIVKVKEAFAVLSEKNGITPGVADIANYTGLSEDKISKILEYEQLKNFISLDQNIYTSEDGYETLLDRIQDSDETNYEEKYEQKKIIEQALELLPQKDREIIKLYYIDEESQKYIAEKFNLSTTHVSRLLKKALSKLYLIMKESMSDSE